MSKVWFVTGSSRGLGRQFVEAALSRGDRVAATARTITGLDDLVDRYGDAVLPLELDVTGRKAVFETVEQAKKHFGRLDVIVNNAGYAQFGAVEELTEQELRDQLETNLFGAVWVIQAALPYLREQRSGHIVQLSSAAGIITMPLGGADRPGLRRRPPAARRDDRQAAPGTRPPRPGRSSSSSIPTTHH
ncbi:SDR family NAD(P)-dependent oxidoreductase [Nonomuraea rubra]|uniref:SDR family NAD(P)-dependent oxidoreductase n=1 Tax=Nonomuraea rubra TaxID=46180 RepID=UPI0036088A23